VDGRELTAAGEIIFDPGPENPPDFDCNSVRVPPIDVAHTGQVQMQGDDLAVVDSRR
jgi:hypothetical protein